MDLKQKILKLLRDKYYVPMRRTEVSAVLKLQKDESQKAHELIERMLEIG